MQPLSEKLNNPKNVVLCHNHTEKKNHGKRQSLASSYISSSEILDMKISLLDIKASQGFELLP